MIAKALIKLAGIPIQSVYSKSKEALPSNFAHRITDAWVQGTSPGELIVHEGGVAFSIDVETGQKTGFFLDQRENRETDPQIFFRKEVFNGFCYTGGFSVYALKGGAKHVVSIDSSAGALELLEKNLTINSFEGTHESIKDNVLTWLGNTDMNV